MGRPIKKSFFANLSNPYQDHATGGPTGEGGEGVASVTITTTGSYTATIPTVSFATPDLYLGTTATGVVHVKSLSASTTANGNGYSLGQTLSVSGGTKSTTATFTTTAVVVAAITKTANGSLYDNDNEIWFDSAGWAVPLKLDVTGNIGGALDTFTVLQYGVWNGPGAAPTTLTATTSNTRGGVDQNATGAVFTVTYGVYSFSSPVVVGDYTAIPANPASFTGATGAGATAEIAWGVSSVEVTNSGSHYVSTADAAVTFSSGAAAGTSVLTALNDQGIAAYAYIIDGVEGSIVDIMKQEASRRYLVKERSGVQGQCKLVAKAAGDLNAGEMCILATDTLGSTYYVTKLTARRAVLSRASNGGSGYSFATGDVAGWNITTPSAGVVTIITV